MTMPHALDPKYRLPTSAAIATPSHDEEYASADEEEDAIATSSYEGGLSGWPTDQLSTKGHSHHTGLLSSAEASVGPHYRSTAEGGCCDMDGRHVLESLSNGAQRRKVEKQPHLSPGTSNGVTLSPLPGSGKEMKGLDEDTVKQKEGSLDRAGANGIVTEKVLKLSPEKIFELTSSPKSLPLHPAVTKLREFTTPTPLSAPGWRDFAVPSEAQDGRELDGSIKTVVFRDSSGGEVASPSVYAESVQGSPIPVSAGDFSSSARPLTASRTVSTPLLRRKHSSTKPTGLSQSPNIDSRTNRSIPAPLNLAGTKTSSRPVKIDESMPSPMPSSIPIPPLSIHTYLQLELSSHRPSPLYIHRSATSDFPYESSRVKIERLTNFLLLPPQLEQVLWFGALACLDAWLYSFTILPLRFLKALYILLQSWGRNLIMEIKFIARFIYTGLGRIWQRRRLKDSTGSSDPPHSMPGAAIQQPQPHSPQEVPRASHSHLDSSRRRSHGAGQKHRRNKSAPSALLPDDKADILKGLLILISCVILMYFDASMMYHSIRGQAAIKLYVIYNVLEVCDRLFSALGQDVLECLFSQETLERKPDGRSKVLRPFGLFILALFYNLVHSTALFYQVITLNVAVNSYSNALLTLLISNQFVEIKSTVFKKFEKENLFQLTCADVVERFQLWLMLMIIASRNIIETSGLSFGGLSLTGSGNGGPTSSTPVKESSILPRSFTIFPDWTGQIMGPFLLVLGSEMLVDWIKHAYITKFNNTKPAIYGRFLDVLAKDYYSNAFADQNLTRRLGLPVIPLSCLFIRASVQTYHMFLATHMPSPLPSPATSLSVDSSSSTTSPATTAALQHMDLLLRRALGHSTLFGAGGAGSRSGPSSSLLTSPWSWCNTDDMIAFAMMLIFFLVVYLVLLAIKLVLGMCLLSFARARYRGMKERERMSAHAEGRRVGGWGVVEVDEDKRRWIYDDDPEGVRKLREREREGREREARGAGFAAVSRYSMFGKRIW